MDVRAVFELPTYIWVMCDALQKTCPSGVGALRFNVEMPSAEGPNGGPPDVAGITERPDLIGDGVIWAHKYGAFIPRSLEPATALHRVALVDVEGPTYEGREWLTPDHQLADRISSWFDEVRTWVEIFTGQDLDPNHRVYDGEMVGSGLTFVEPPHEGHLGVTLTTPSVRPLRAEEWALILRLVRDGKEPPLEELLSRDARASLRRNACRRSIIEAATAVEIALSRHIRSIEKQLPDGQRKNLTDRTTLGGYVAIAENSRLPLRVSIERLRALTRLRNAAAHQGQSPSSWDAGAAVETMIDVLGAHGQLRRTGEREPDGGEWVVADSQERDPAPSSD